MEDSLQMLAGGCPLDMTEIVFLRWYFLGEEG
jgi:hypothetical protein